MPRTAARTATGPTLALLLAAAATLGCREPVAADGAGLSLMGVDGVPVRPLAEPHPPATVFLFVRTHCPISNRYAPEVRRLHEAFGPAGVRIAESLRVRYQHAPPGRDGVVMLQLDRRAASGPDDAEDREPMIGAEQEVGPNA